MVPVHKAGPRANLATTGRSSTVPYFLGSGDPAQTWVPMGGTGKGQFRGMGDGMGEMLPEVERVFERGVGLLLGNWALHEGIRCEWE